MTEVDFYRIAGSDEQSRDAFACRLVEKVYKLGKGVYVHAANPTQAQNLDQLLWTYRQGSFVPHGRVGEEDPECPVLIGHDHEPDGHAQTVLLNMTAEVPAFIGCFERVAEIVNESDPIREDGRRKYRHYQERGYPLRFHDLAEQKE